jgi:hypothetical protein
MLFSIPKYPFSIPCSNNFKSSPCFSRTQVFLRTITMSKRSKKKWKLPVMELPRILSPTLLSLWVSFFVYLPSHSKKIFPFILRKKIFSGIHYLIFFYLPKQLFSSIYFFVFHTLDFFVWTSSSSWLIEFGPCCSSHPTLLGTKLFTSDCEFTH